MATRPAKPEVADPPGFRLDRSLDVGRHPILTVFPGLDRLGPAGRIEREPSERTRLFRETWIELVDQDMWMYVAPRELPPLARARGWKPVVAPDADCIVVGLGHLRESPAMILFLDIYHELCHILQRRAGANLWEPGVSYVERRTEVDAYRFVVHEAKALGVPDDYLREYLKVEWITKKEHEQLLEAVGVPPLARPRPRART
jgi:hypothetical protein